MRDLPLHPFDADKLHEECGVFGVIGVADAANFVALGMHALQHRGQEAGGIVAYDPEQGFNSARRFGYVRDNFTNPTIMGTLPGSLAIGHVRYSTAGSKGNTAIRDVQPFFGEFSMGGGRYCPQWQSDQRHRAAARTDRTWFNLSIVVGQRMYHSPDGTLDPNQYPRTDQRCAAPG